MRYSLEEATKKAVLRNPLCKRIIQTILDWDTEMTAVELAKVFKIRKVTIYKFASRYHLTYARFGKRKKTSTTELRQKLVNQLINEGYQTQQIAQALGVKHQYITQIKGA